MTPMSKLEILVCDYCNRHSTEIPVNTWTAVANPSGERWTADLCTDCAAHLLTTSPATPTQARKRRRVVKAP